MISIYPYPPGVASVCLAKGYSYDPSYGLSLDFRELMRP